MLRLPVRLLAGALIGALMLSLTSLLGVMSTLGAADASAPDPRAAVELDTDITLNIANCEGCGVTLASSDGISSNFSEFGTVTGGSVTITIPSERTAGMSVRIVPTWLTAPGTLVVWRYAGEEIGAPVSFKAARSKKRASGCWAGTVNEAVSLTVKVRRITYRGRPGAIAWAPVTESFLPPMEKVRGGVLVNDGVLACTLYG